MKNLIIFVLATLLGLECFSQGKPICPYNENGYTVSQVKSFALEPSELSANYRGEILKIINAGLINSGENLVLDQRHISWIFQHVKDSAVQLNSFVNSYKIGNVIYFKDDKNFSGMVGVFQYKKCRLILYKTICLNLLKVPPIPVETGTKIEQIDPVVNNNNNVNTNHQNQFDENNSNNTGGNTFVVRTGGTFIPDQQYYQPQPNYYGSNSFVVRTGGKFISDHQMCGGGYRRRR